MRRAVLLVCISLLVYCMIILRGEVQHDACDFALFYIFTLVNNLLNTYKKMKIRCQVIPPKKFQMNVEVSQKCLVDTQLSDCGFLLNFGKVLAP